ncbi:hypothetical protein BC826DRAFT_1014067 [Russula brevipes]|nr:hypothetical protein BC826DRAFT_1014067 [Russula brevipes]
MDYFTPLVLLLVFLFPTRRAREVATSLRTLLEELGLSNSAERLIRSMMDDATVAGKRQRRKTPRCLLFNTPSHGSPFNLPCCAK